MAAVAPPIQADGGRDAELAARYASGSAALTARDYRGAIDIFAALERDAPDYRDTAAQLARAREGLRGVDVQAALNAAGASEAAGDLATALGHYRRAQQLDPASVDASTLDGLRNRMRQVAAKALDEAKNFELYSQRERAIDAYRRALQNLTADDPARAQAQAGLDRLQRTRP